MDIVTKASDSPLFFVVTAVLVLLLARLSLKLRSWHQRKKQNYPPVAATIFHQLTNLHRLHDFHTNLSQKYRTFRVLTPFCNYIYTVDPANVEYILRTNSANYGKGKFNYDLLEGLLGDGIFAVDGEKWRHQRKIASYEFSAKNLRDYSSIVFRNTAIKLAKIVSEAASSGHKMDLQDLLMKGAMDSIFKVAFGVELDTLSGSNAEGKIFSNAFDDSNSLVLRRYYDVFWKIKRALNIGLEAVMKKNIKLIDDFVYKQIDTKIKQMSEQYEDDSTKKEDILSRFIIEREKDPKNISSKYLRDITLSFVIAGRDTTAGTLAWFLYALCKHPDVQEKVAQEVKKATGTTEKIPATEFAATLTEEALNRMQYLHAALTETLRLYPVIPVDAKYCFSDDTLPDGSSVNKGDVVHYQPYAMGRMSFLWGEDAETFRPERWLNKEGVFEPESPFKFTAFQAGPRICLGKEFAYRQMKTFAATLLHFFKFKLSDEREVVNYRSMVTLQIDGGLHLCALHR